MFDRILKTIMAFGAAAAVTLVLVLIFGRSTGSHHAAAVPTVTPVPTVATVPSTAATVVSPPAPPPTPALQPSPEQRCARNGKACRTALLALINQARAEAALPPLTLDLHQSNGGPTGRCAGSKGHSRAMAQSGRIWRRNPRYPGVSYPRDICGPVTRSAENIGVAAGPEWQALQRIEGRMARSGRRAQRTLLSRRFTRAGIGIARSGNRYYVTVDLMG